MELDLANRIGADCDLFTSPQHTRSRILDVLRREAKIEAPWYDAGAGDGYHRQKLTEFSAVQPKVTEEDLDTGVFPVAPTGGFETITAIELIEHLYNPLQFLLTMKSLLADTGNFYLTTPNDYSLIYKCEHLLSRKYRPHFHQFSERDIRDIFARAQFPIITLKKFFRSRTGTIARISRNGFFIHARRPLQRP